MKEIERLFDVPGQQLGIAAGEVMKLWAEPEWTTSPAFHANLEKLCFELIKDLGLGQIPIGLLPAITYIAAAFLAIGRIVERGTDNDELPTE